MNRLELIGKWIKKEIIYVFLLLFLSAVSYSIKGVNGVIFLLIYWLCSNFIYWLILSKWNPKYKEGTQGDRIIIVSLFAIGIYSFKEMLPYLNGVINSDKATMAGFFIGLIFGAFSLITYIDGNIMARYEKRHSNEQVELLLRGILQEYEVIKKEETKETKSNPEQQKEMILEEYKVIPINTPKQGKYLKRNKR